MSSIQALDLTLRRGGKVVLQNARFMLHSGEKVALVGRNGAGKSSLFALMSGSLHEDGGTLSFSGQPRLAQVAQDMPVGQISALDFVLQGDTLLQAAHQALHAALQAAEPATAAESATIAQVAQVAQEQSYAGDHAVGLAIAHAHALLDEAGAHDAAARAAALLAGLGFDAQEQQRGVESFSGGWRMRLQLARALMAPSDVLLLDEPTNHLDLDAVVWLEQWLQRYSATLIVISHDRVFLDAVVQVTLHLENQTLTRYSGNYSAFEEQRARALELQSAAYVKQQARAAHLQSFIDRFRAKATKAKQAQSRIKALERMQRVAPVRDEQDLSFAFRAPVALPNPLLSLQDARMGYDALEPILQGVSLSILTGQRLGILGANGQGKSTLIKSLAQALPLLGGRMVQGKGLRIGYFAQQEMEVLQPLDSPLLHLRRLAASLEDGSTEQEQRNFLGQFQFQGEMALRSVHSMSGGEKARLLLALLVWQRPSLLLLDEPSNHLDMATRAALALALQDYAGALIVVSHDRSLLASVCDEFKLVRGGQVEPFDDDLQAYQQYLMQQARVRQSAVQPQTQGTGPDLMGVEGRDRSAHFAAAAGPSHKEARAAAAQQRQQRLQQARPWRQKIAQQEARMTALHQEKTELETALSAADADFAALSQRHQAVQHALDAAESIWLEASVALERIEQGG